MDALMRGIKQKFMAMRNGITADVLRRAGLPHKVIFGLNLPQLTDIARGLTQSSELASALWADADVRESRLLAPMVMPDNLSDRTLYMRMARECRTQEECDILCFRLLRRLPEAREMAVSLGQAENALVRYCGMALERNLTD